MKHRKIELTEEDILNSRKVAKGSFYGGEKNIYYKKAKNDIINLGDKDFLNEISYRFSLPAYISLLLFVALSGNEELTTFKRDKRKALNKIAKETPAIVDYNEEDYKKSNKNEYFIKYTSSKGFAPKVVMDNIKNEKWKAYHFNVGLMEIEPYSEVTTNYILDILLCNKLYTFEYENEEGTDEYYTEVYDKFYSLRSKFNVKQGGMNDNGIKATKYKHHSNIKEEWKLDKRESYFDYITGELKLVATNGVSTHYYEFNMKEDSIESLLNVFTSDEGFTGNIIMNVILNSIKLTRKEEDIFYSILHNYLKNHGMKLIEYFRHVKSFFHFKLKNINLKFQSHDKHEDYKQNILKYIYDAFLIFDKVRNNDDFDFIHSLEKFIKVPNKKKVKPSDLLVPNRNLYKKLKSLDTEEAKNVLSILNTMKDWYPHLYNEVNINTAFNDDFSMMEYRETVKSILKFISEEELSHLFKMSDLRKLVRYIDVDIPQRQSVHTYSIASTYNDYIHFVKKLVDAGFRTEESINFAPYSIRMEHDIASSEYVAVRDAVNNKKLEDIYNSSDELEFIFNKTYKYDNENIVMLKADSSQKLIDEGKALSHCVGGYASKIINGTCIIMLARKKDNVNESWFTVEFRKTSHGYALGQTQSKNAYKLPKELEEQLLTDIKKANKNIKGLVA